MGGKTLVLYVFFEYNDLVKYFLKNAVFQDDSVDFIIISNNPSVNLDLPPYVKKLQRENIGYDFGGWSDALLKDNLYMGYENFIFVNSTVIGPFLPMYYKGKWTDIYVNGLEGNIHLFGSTINTCRQPKILSHVQSYIFSMKIHTVKLMMACEIFSNTKYVSGRDEAVNGREILMSRIILQLGGNIASLMKYYNNVDFTFSSKDSSAYANPFLDDVMYEEFNNKIWNTYELVFVKGNRISGLLPQAPRPS